MKQNFSKKSFKISDVMHYLDNRIIPPDDTGNFLG